MIFDLKNEAAETIPNFKGGEGSFIAKIHFDGMNKIIHGTLEPGSTIGRHTHSLINNGTENLVFFAVVPVQ